jgi:hypothetical protein
VQAHTLTHTHTHRRARSHTPHTPLHTCTTNIRAPACVRSKPPDRSRPSASPKAEAPLTAWKHTSQTPGHQRFSPHRHQDISGQQTDQPIYSGDQRTPGHQRTSADTRTSGHQRTTDTSRTANGQQTYNRQPKPRDTQPRHSIQQPFKTQYTKAIQNTIDNQPAGPGHHIQTI